MSIFFEKAVGSVPYFSKNNVSVGQMLRNKVLIKMWSLSNFIVNDPYFLCEFNIISQVEFYEFFAACTFLNYSYNYSL